ncbi:tripartite tricarboxylate transporter substrate binding protein [Allopusillimonas ginsengisoli]|uniref:tripartite tricarboxylate transporter substrate binding protein n=1 Tax=Allopusillimonas ginsengisoli TaxID=453575 RepID=UPI001020F09D|nr:tripartite tricarboxylate transporter substrate binding protein [Allopusillimonas ginsengisoli]TEA76926.1 tripartite tricarboxylate transporter substrate binding protein [Allopusillimonas ginsengisoli]
MARFTVLAPLVLSITLALASESALAYPDKTVRVVVPFPPGTVTDLIARKYAEELSQRLGQSFVVENKPGAGGTVAAQHVASSTADGYTVMFVSSSFAAAPALNPKIPYDTLNDFSGVALLGSTPTLVITNSQAGINTLSDLIKQAKSKELTYGSAGVGSAAHLACEYFSAAAGIKPLHIPYKGSNEYVAEVRAGRIDFACPPIATPLALLRAHDLNGVAVMDSARSPLIPDVPTAEEAGLNGVEYGIWYGVLVRHGVPADAIDILSRTIKEINDKGDLAEPLKAQGITLKYLPPIKFDTYIKEEVSKYQKIVDNVKQQ